MQDLKLTAGVVVDSSGAEKGFKQVSDGAGKMAADVSTSANKAGAAVDKIGNGAGAGAEKFTRAASQIRTAIQKSTAEIESFGKTASQKLEMKISAKGLDAAQFAPYLAELKRVEAAHMLAAGSAEKMTLGFSGIQSAALVATAAIGGLAIAFKKVIDGVDALNDLKDATGASIENISALEDVAIRTGASFSTVETSLIKLNKVLSDAKPGNEAGQAFQALGLSVKELQSLDPAESFLKTAQALQGFADDSNKARLVQELFGKSLKEVAPLLKDLAEKGALVATVTTEQADAAEKFNKEIFNLTKSASDLSRTLAGSMAESINKTIELFREGAKEGRGFLSVMASEQWRLLGLNDGPKEYAKRIADITEKLKDNNIHEAKRASLLREQAALQAKLPQQVDSSYDALEQSRLNRAKPSLPSISVASTAKAVKKVLSEYDKLIQKLGVDLPKAAAEAEASQMGYNKAQTEFIALANSPAWAKFSSQERANVALKYEGIIASEQAVAAEKQLAKSNMDAAQARDKYVASLATGLEKIQADIAAQIEATARMGLSKEAIADLDAAKLEMLATDLELQAIKAMDRNLDDQTYAALKQQATAYRDLATAKKTGAAKGASLDMEKASSDAAVKAEAEWQKTAASINNTLTDALMRGFESGKDFAKNMRDTIVNMFKTMVLRPIISAVMTPISAAITGGLGMSGAANAASGGANALSAIGTGSSIYNTLGSAGAAIGQFGTGVLASTQSLLGMTGTAAQFSTALNTGALAVNNISAYSAAAPTMFSQLAAAVPYAAIAVAALAAFGAFRKTKQTGTGISGTLGDDQSLTGFNEMRKSGYLFGGPKYWDEIKAIDPLMAKALKADFTAIKAAATGAADALGLASDSVAGFSKAFRIEFTGDKSKDEALYKDLMAGVSEDLARSILGSYKETIATVIDQIDSGAGWDSGEARTKDVQRQVTTSAYTPSEFAREGETASQTLQRLATSITLVNGTFDLLGRTLYAGSLSGADMASKLADAFGGLDRLTAATAAYYDSYYTEAEKTANATRSITDALAGVGLAMPATKEAFRALVDAQDLTTNSGRTAYAALLNVSGGFDQVATATANMLAQMQANVASAQQSIATLNGVSQSAYSAQVIQAAATSTFSAVSAAMPWIKDIEQLKTIDLSKGGDFEKNYKADNQALITAALAAAATVYTANQPAAVNTPSYTSTPSYTEPAYAPDTSAADALAELARVNRGWADQLDILTGKETERSIALRDAGDDSTRALMGLVYAAQDLKKAGDEAAAATKAAAESFASLMGGLANTKYDLQNQLLTEQGNTEQVRLNEIAKLTQGLSPGDAATATQAYDDNDALKKTIADLQTAKAEAAKMLDAAIASIEKLSEYDKKVGEERSGLQTQLNALTDTAAQSLTRQRDALDLSNRALFDSIQLATKAKATEDEKRGLQTQLNALTDTASQALTRQRDALQESNRALFDQITALTRAKEVAAERTGLQTQLNTLTDTNAQALERQRNALDESNRALFDQVQAATAAKAAIESSKTNTGNALAGVQRAIDAEKRRVGIIQQAAQESVSATKGLFDSIESSVKSLYSSVKSESSAAQGRAFIDEALATAKATGYLPDQDALLTAIDNAKGGLDAEQYASQFEADRATLVMAGKLSQLGEITGKQLTAQELALKSANDQLDALDNQMQIAREQVDVMRGIDVSVLSVQTAIANLTNAISAERGATAAAEAGGGGASYPVTALESAGEQTAQKYGATLAGMTAGSAKSSALFLGEIAKLPGQVDPAFIKEQLAFFASLEMPSYAVGTNYVPRDMVAQIHEGEAIVPRAYNPAAGGAMGSGNTERLERLVEGLTAEVQRLQSIVSNGNENTRRTADAVNGNPDQPMLVQTV